NRMRDPAADARQLATLRDQALRLAAVADQHPQAISEVRKQADILNRYPDLPADPNARTEPVRLRDAFTHDDIAVLLGGCSGRSGHAIEFELSALSRRRAFTEDETARIERLGYKVALIAELDREFGDRFVPANRPGLREEWVRLADNVRQGGWVLAEAARGTD